MHYRCFDRILLNGIIQPFQQEERVVGFFNSDRQFYPVIRSLLRDIALQFHNWVQFARKNGKPRFWNPPPTPCCIACVLVAEVGQLPGNFSIKLVVNSVAFEAVGIPKEGSP